MSIRRPRLAASAVLLALILGACGDTEPTAPTAAAASAPAASAAQVYSYSAVVEGVVQVPLGDVVSDCLAEPLEVHYRGRLRVMLAQMAGGERSLSSVHLNDMGSWALGLGSGTVYRLVGSSIDRSTDNAGGYGNGASTWTSAGRQQYVGPGGRAFTVRSSYRLTVTPDGTLAAERISSTLECR
ncbi:MAG TPA: hypothetical protein VEB59_14380 [Gemmatimonadales bacterium]|nr:hypothetical protein [Gemmatimonadales bacterium]